jgi:hypothetical protein
MLRRKVLWIVSVGSAIAAVVGVSAQGVSAHSRPAVGSPAFARQLSPSLRASGHWITAGHKRVWVVPLLLQAKRRGGIKARAADLEPCVNSVGSATKYPICVSPARNAGSGLCMTSLGGGSGQAVEQYPCNGSTNQTWWLYDNSGYWFLWNEGSSGGPLGFPHGYCLDDKYGDQDNYTPLIMYPCDAGGTPEHFNGYATNPQPDFEIRLTTAANECVSNEGNYATAAPMELFTCNHSPNQAFNSVTLANDNGGGW